LAARFTGLYVGIACASYLAQWTGEDNLDNAQFDLVIATGSASASRSMHRADVVRAPLRPPCGARHRGAGPGRAAASRRRVSNRSGLFAPAYRAEF